MMHLPRGLREPRSDLYAGRTRFDRLDACHFGPTWFRIECVDVAEPPAQVEVNHVLGSAPSGSLRHRPARSKVEQAHTESRFRKSLDEGASREVRIEMAHKRPH